MTAPTDTGQMIACYCHVGPLGHAHNPTLGWCPNPPVTEVDR